MISDVTAVTMDAERRVVRDAAIVIDGARIAAVGKRVDVIPSFPDIEVLDGRGMIALPGFVDAHAHADQTLLRGRTDDLTWIPFLSDWINPYLTQRDPAVAVVAYRLAIVEMIHSGTTTFVSPNVDERDDLAALTRAIADLGVRAVLARWVDRSEAVQSAVDAIRDHDLAADGRIRVRFGLDIPRLEGDRYQPELYAEVAQRCRELGSGLVYHFCSEVEDWTWYVDRFGVRPTHWAASEGILGPDALLINACWVTPSEVGTLAQTGTPIVHSPSANMKMASGTLASHELREAGVVVALGTDGPANNNSFDLLREMKAACLLANATGRRAGTLHAEDALEMATIDGARAIGQGDILGSLEVGKRADIVLIDLAHPHTWPVTDPVSNVVFAAHGGNVDTVLVDGRILLRGGTLLVADEPEILMDAARAATAVAPLLPDRPWRWPVS